MRILDLTTEQSKKPGGDRGGDRAAAAGFDDDAVYRADRGNLGGGAGEKQLVGDVQAFARQALLAQLDAELAGDRDDRIARDTGQDRRRRRRSIDDAAAHDE